MNIDFYLFGDSFKYTNMIQNKPTVIEFYNIVTTKRIVRGVIEIPAGTFMEKAELDISTGEIGFNGGCSFPLTFAENIYHEVQIPIPVPVEYALLDRTHLPVVTRSRVYSPSRMRPKD